MNEHAVYVCNCLSSRSVRFLPGCHYVDNLILIVGARRLCAFHCHRPENAIIFYLLLRLPSSILAFNRNLIMCVWQENIYSYSLLLLGVPL